MNMINDSLLKLRLAFSNIPMKGLFFWEGLLFLDDDQYKKTIEENLINTINSSIPSENKELRAYYTEILNALKEVRKGIAEDPKVKSSIEEIRESLIGEAADEIIVNDMKDNLAQKETDL